MDSSRRSARVSPGSRRMGHLKRVPVVALLTVALFLLMVAAAVAFSDVPASHPYQQAIQTLSDRGIINGFPDDSFRPDSPVTRQQFAKMIVLTLGLPVSESNVVPFTDVQIGGFADPFYPDDYIAVAAANGITTGTGPGKFSPAADIKRAQVVTMVIRAAENVLPPGTLATPPTGYTGSLPNFSAIHSPNMRMAEYNGLLAGLQGFGASWDPLKSASRGEVAQMLAGLLALTPSSSSTTSTSGSTTSTSGSTTTVSSSSTTTVTSSTTTTTDDSANRVRIDDLAFTPATLTVAVGATVTWRNDDTVPHTVTADGGTFTSPTLAPGATYSRTFSAAGTFPYHCSIHTSMHGTIMCSDELEPPWPRCGRGLGK